MSDEKIKNPRLAAELQKGIEQEGRGGLALYSRAMQIAPERLRKAISTQEFTADEIERAKSLRLFTCRVCGAPDDHVHGAGE